MRLWINILFYWAAAIERAFIKLNQLPLYAAKYHPPDVAIAYGQGLDP